MIRPHADHDARKKPRQSWTPGLLVVKIKQDTVRHLPEIHKITAASLRESPLPKAFAQPFEALLKRGKILDVVPLFSPPGKNPMSPLKSLHLAAHFATSVQEVEDEDLAGINILRLHPRTNLDAEARRLNETPGVDYCHKVPRRWLAAPSRAVADPMLNRQWNLRAIEWFQAQPLPDASEIKVAILDTGIDTKHPDLPKPTTYTHSGELSVDIIGHGTHVAGVIAARTNNAVGIAGIANPELHVWKIFDDEPDEDDGEYYTDNKAYLRALAAALEKKVQVINLSIGGDKTSRTEDLLFGKLNEAGIHVVAAMGNEYQEGNPVEYPAAHRGVIAVGAVDQANHRAVFSSTGPHITISAPGVGILSTLPTKASDARPRGQINYDAWDGTSMATPHVTAAIALLLAKNPEIDPADVIKRLKKSALPLPRGTRNTVGAGLLNIKSMLV